VTDQSILLFLHGVGDGDRDNNWKASLTGTLTRLHYPDLDAVRVIAPKYAHALKGWDDRVRLPGETIRELPREAAKKNRREFERRMGAIEFRLGRHDHGKAQFGADAFVDLGVGLGGAGVPSLKQAHNYLHDPQIRAQVLTRILENLPKIGKLTIVGHSLGSVIAADLVRRLPPGLEVTGLITIGSPLANGSFDVDKLRQTMKEPPTNLAWWVNFWNARDPIAAHRGVSSVFPWMIDFRIATKKVGFPAHYALEYLTNEAVAAAIGFALFGSRSQELAEINNGLDIPVDATEQVALVALRYVHLLKASLKDDQKDRFTGALRHVQATVVDDLQKRNALERRPMPSAVARLAFDLSNPQAPLPEPRSASHIEKEDAVVLMTLLASENVIRPFEITISKNEWQGAMRDLTAEMGLGSQYGADVFAAAKDAQAALSGGRGVNWVRWGALGAGAALIVVATGGLAIAAGAGLAGAAVITSALAAFGPGGMMGGLLTAGTLLTAGGSGIALGLASPGTTAETLELVVSRQLAAVILRQRQDLEQDPAVWKILAETEIEVRRQHERLDEFSDDSSPSLKELKRKIMTIERALNYLTVNGLEPDLPATQ